MGIILILKTSNRIETNCFLQIIKKKENARVSNLKINVGFFPGRKIIVCLLIVFIMFSNITLIFVDVQYVR